MIRDREFSREGRIGSEELLSEHPYALVRALEASVEVRRRFQFFGWVQSHLHPLVRNHLVVCGAYQRARRDLVFETFNSIVVPSQVIAMTTSSNSRLMRNLIDGWVASNGRPVMFRLNGGSDPGSAAEEEVLLRAGFEELLVHGVARPQRPAELESLFVFAAADRLHTALERSHLELILPHLHATWLRVQATERELAGSRDAVPLPRRPFHRAPITEREAQVLTWVREGLSNQQIGDQLGISVLTVKNHVQKILQKLGAANRAQAVAKAMALNLLTREEAMDKDHDERPGA